MKARISHELLARRAALELQPGQVVNLGSGLASMVVGHVPAGRGVIFHAENGLVGYAPRRGHARGEPDLVDAGGEPVSLLPGGAIVNQAESFGMIRGGHVDVGMVEAYQVSDRGDLVQLTASTEHSGGLVGSVEVAAWAKRVVAVIEHTTPEGSPRIVRECSYPAALLRCVDLIVTDAAVIEVSSEGLVLRELAPGWTPEEVQAITGANLVQAPDIMEMDFSQPQEKPVGKIYANAAEAMADIPDGAVILLDGFAGPGGMAQYLMVALRDHGAKNLTMVSNTAGIALVASFGTPPGFSTIDHSLLVDNHQIKKSGGVFSRFAIPVSSLLVRACLQEWGSRTGAGAPGHAGRTHQGRRLRYRRLLYNRWRGYPDRRGQADTHNKRSRVCPGVRHQGRLRPDTRPQGRQDGQPGI